IDQRAPYSIDSPDHDHIEAAPLRLLQHFIKTGTLVPALGTAYSCVAKSLDNLPPSAQGNLGEPRNLIFDRLPVCADADVQRCALHFGYPPQGKCGIGVIGGGESLAWVTDHFPHRPLPIERHGGNRAIPRHACKVILNGLEADALAWEELLAGQ